ncbi:XRE family transcriptional regulator [Streptomyces sp. NPDC050732]|uniref:XRE family transcriptional regulator n=1 Tax=Streptomyces sp. NPDC050732 TaxID=3154632 RepID=UPI0034405695
MPRWKALPEELDPEVKEFAGQLRRLVDRSGLSIAAVSDRTGYSKTSWERYLNGRLLAPKGAIVALAEVTGTQPVHLITMWELAERAWSRSEMRHDMTMQAIRISQARAALGETGAHPTGPGQLGQSGQVSSSSQSSPPSPSSTSSPSASAVPAKSSGWGVRPVTGVAGPAGVSPTVPPHVSPFGEAGGGGESPDGQRRRRKLTMFLAGVVGALVVIAAAVFMTGFGDDDKGDDKAKPSATPTAKDTDLPAGVECSGKDCAGKDPENMGCGGELARTTSRATVGTTLVEVRYSKTCGAAWARITQATPGDELTITGSGGGASAKQNSTVNEDFDAYTPMVAVTSGTAAKACATLTSGVTGCTE